MQKSRVKKLFVSELMLSANATKRIVYVALITAFNVVSNMFLEFRMSDTQFSITIAVSVLSGVLLGSVFGFIACFIGDLIGFFISSWGYLYMPWVGLSTALTAFIAGIIINGFKWKFKGQTALKVVLTCILSLLICTIAINSTGFYFYNYKMGFSTAVIDYVKKVFGTDVGYIGYVAYRMIFKGQILNCLFNYAIIGIAVPLILNAKIFGKKNSSDPLSQGEVFMKAKVYLTDKQNGKFLEYTETVDAPFYPAEVVEATTEKYKDSEASMLNVHSDVEYQSVFGIGGAFTETSAVNYAKMSKDKKDEVMDTLFSKEKGMGFNFGRTSINSCDFSVDDYTYVKEGDMELSTFDISREKEKVIPMIKDAYKRADVEIFSSPWSAPSYMKTNGSNLAGYLKEDCYGLWAKYIKKYIEEMEKEGVKIWGITMQNEPRHAQTWESCNYTPEQEIEFLGHIGKELEGTGKKILCYDHCRERVYERAKATFESKYGKYCDGVANHWYSGDHYGEMKATWYKYPDKLQVASEGCIGNVKPGYNDDVAIAHAETYLHDLITCFNGGTNYYCIWNLIVDENSGPCHHRENRGLYVDAPVYYDTKTGKVDYDLFLYYMGHISKFVDKGAKVIATSLYTNKIDAVAFKNPDGKIVVVAMNGSNEKRALNVRMDKHLIKTSLDPHTAKTFVYEEQ